MATIDDRITPAQSRRGLAANPYLMLGLAACLGHLLVGYWRTSGGYLFSDDFLNFMQAAEVEGGWRFLIKSVFGQYVPLYRATNLLVEQAFGASYAATRTTLLLVSTGSVAAAMALCARIRAPLYLTSAIGLFLACYWLPMDGQDWWSAGLHCVPGGTALAVAVYAAARPVAPLPITDKLVVALAFGVGVGFYNAVLLTAPLIGAVRLYARYEAMPGVPHLQRFTGAVADLALVIATALCAVAFLVWVRPPGGGTAIPLTDLIEAMWIGLAYGLGAGVVGLSGFGPGDSAGWLWLGGLLGALVLVAAPALSIWRRPVTVWLWGGLYAFVLLQCAVIGSERAAEFGVWAMTSSRYNLSNVLAFMLVAALAFGGTSRASTYPSATQKSHVLLGVSVVIVMFAMVHTATGLTRDRAWDVGAVRAFMKNLTDTAPAGPATVGNRMMPNIIVPRWMGVYATLEKYAPVSPAELELTRWADARHYLADDGSLQAIDDAETRTWMLASGATISVRVLPELEGAGAVTAFFERPSPGVSGWVAPIISDEDRVEVVAVDARGVVHPAAETGVPSPSLVAAYRMGSFGNAGFHAPLPQDASVDGVKAYILVDRRVAIPLLATASVETTEWFPYVDPASLGAALEIEGPVIIGDFAPDGWYPDAGAPDWGGGGWASHRPRGDAGIGAMTLSFVLPAGVSGMAVPIITGPNSAGARFILRDGQTGAVLSELVEPDGVSSWRLWAPEIGVAEHERTLELEIRDDSAEWGAWVGIGMPQAIE